MVRVFMALTNQYFNYCLRDARNKKPIGLPQDLIDLIARIHLLSLSIPYLVIMMGPNGRWAESRQNNYKSWIVRESNMKYLRSSTISSPALRGNFLKVISIKPMVGRSVLVRGREKHWNVSLSPPFVTVQELLPSTNTSRTLDISHNGWYPSVYSHT